MDCAIRLVDVDASVFVTYLLRFRHD